MADLLSLFPPGSALTPDGGLLVDGCRAADLAAQFGTPTLVVSETALRSRAREYAREFAARWPNSRVVFASKAFPCTAVQRVMSEEGIGLDVAGGGEIITALRAGADPASLVLHGNAKTDDEIQLAVNKRIGLIVIDNADDVDRLDRLGRGRRPQPALIRINPAVPGATHAAVDTGSEEAKFGVALGDAPALIERANGMPAIDLLGLHVHIGSQLVDLDGFGRAAEAIARLGRFGVYDLGGGLGVAYRPEERAPSIADYAAATVRALHEHLDPAAHLIVEPGRSVVGRAGLTLYSVVTVKRGARTHVAVDGGMGDNLEPMMYDTRFAPAIVDRDRPLEVCDLVGHHCESGDVLAPQTALATPRSATCS